MGSVAKSYMRRGFLIYEEMRKYLVIYEEAVSQIWLCNRSHLNFLIYEENFIFFFIRVWRKNMTWRWFWSPLRLRWMIFLIGRAGSWEKSNIIILRDCLFNYCQLLESSTPRRICSRRRRRRTMATRPTRPATTHPRSNRKKFFKKSVQTFFNLPFIRRLS